METLCEARPKKDILKVRQILRVNLLWMSGTHSWLILRQSYNITILQCHNPTMSQSYNVTILQCQLHFWSGCTRVSRKFWRSTVLVLNEVDMNVTCSYINYIRWRMWKRLTLSCGFDDKCTRVFVITCYIYIYITCIIVCLVCSWSTRYYGSNSIFNHL